jgi:hypothetical protein
LQPATAPGDVVELGIAGRSAQRQRIVTMG